MNREQRTENRSQKSEDRRQKTENRSQTSFFFHSVLCSLSSVLSVRFKRANGLTLIEVLVAISIASILILGISGLLDTALTSWQFSLEEANISKLAEETMLRMADGDYGLPGIRAAMEMVEAAPGSIAFVPLWTDVFDRIPDDGKFVLSRRVRTGSVSPTGEIRFPGKGSFQPYWMKLETDGAGGRQWAEFGFPIAKGSIVRISYQPDHQVHPEMIMRYEWNRKERRVLRTYNKESSDFNLKRSEIYASEVEFVYLDGSARELAITREDSRKRSQLIHITAVKIKATFQGKQLTRTSETFVNIRALGKGGHGIILSPGIQIPIPNSKDIQVLRLVNFSNVREGTVLAIKIHSPKGDKAYRVRLFLGDDGGRPVLRKQEVYYPEDQLVFESIETRSLRHGYDFLKIGFGGLYDYDDDPNVADKVLFLDDPVYLEAEKMDTESVMLVVRP